MDQKTLVAAAVAGLFTLGAAQAVLAADQEKCWGVAKAGQNDCSTNKSAHACTGQSKANYDPNDYKLVKAGTCVQMGGSLTQGQAGRLAKQHMMKKG